MAINPYYYENQKNPAKKKTMKMRAIYYNELLNEGKYKNMAELSRGLDVSRAWITKVMKFLPVERGIKKTLNNYMN